MPQNARTESNAPSEGGEQGNKRTTVLQIGMTVGRLRQMLTRGGGIGARVSNSGLLYFTSDDRLSERVHVQAAGLPINTPFYSLLLLCVSFERQLSISAS